MRSASAHHRLASRRGSALSMSIVLSVVMSALISALAWSAGAANQQTANIAKMDQAFYAAESGAQVLAWYARNNLLSTIPNGFTGKTIKGYNVSSTWSSASGLDVAIASTGSLPSSSSISASYTLSATISPPNGAATFASKGNFNMKNTTIVGGAVVTLGSYSNGAGTGNASLTGNLWYGTTASDLNDVSGDHAQDTSKFVAIDFNNLLASLGSYTIFAPGTNVSVNLDSPFTLNHTAYFAGDVTDLNISGSGTIYVNGKITFTKQITIGADGAPVHLVATGDINFQKNTTMYGSIYSNGNLNRAQLDLNGVLYVNGMDASNNGSGTWTFANVPSWDPRRNVVVSGVGTLSYSKVTGPQP